MTGSVCVRIDRPRERGYSVIARRQQIGRQRIDSILSESIDHSSDRNWDGVRFAEPTFSRTARGSRATCEWHVARFARGGGPSMQMRVLAAVVISFALGACSGSDDPPSVDPMSGAAPYADHDVRTSGDAGAAKKEAGASTPTKDAGSPPPTSKPDAGAPGPTKPPPRVDLNALSGTDQQRIFDAITGFIRNATISVKVANQQVVTWEDNGTLTPVSVVRAHHSIHHGGDRFFTCHRWYLQTMEKAIAASLPNGRLPAWNPSMPMPTPFRTLARPTKGGDCETMGSLTRTDFFGNVCEFAWTNSYTNVNGDYVTIQGLENTDPGVSFPSKYLPGNICAFSTATALANDIGAGFTNSTGYHNLVHNTIGGTMQTMDAPEAAIFWPWHATIDQIFQNWLDCGKAPPPVCF